MAAESLIQNVTSWEFEINLFCLLAATDGAGRNPSINVEVKRLDYGDTSCVPLCHIKQLSPEMAVLPLQALQVSLAHVSSPVLHYSVQYITSWI